MSLWLGTRRTPPPSKLASDPCADPAKSRYRLQHHLHCCSDEDRWCIMRTIDLPIRFVHDNEKCYLGATPAVCCQASKQSSFVQSTLEVSGRRQTQCIELSPVASSQHPEAGLCQSSQLHSKDTDAAHQQSLAPPPRQARLLPSAYLRCGPTTSPSPRWSSRCRCGGPGWQCRGPAGRQGQPAGAAACGVAYWRFRAAWQQFQPAQHDGQYAAVCTAHRGPTGRLAQRERHLQARLVQLSQQTCMALPSACPAWDRQMATGTTLTHPRCAGATRLTETLLLNKWHQLMGPTDVLHKPSRVLVV